VRNPACIWTALSPGADTKHDPDVLIIDLDPPHQGEDEVALGGPIRLAQPIADHGCEDLQLTDDELQRARLLGGVAECGNFGLELGDAPAQARQPRLELRLADHAFRIAVDQPARPGAQLAELALQRLQLGPTRPAAHGLQAALVFVRDAGRVLEQAAHLGPDRRVQRLNRQGFGIALPLAGEAMAVRPGAAVVAVPLLRRTQRDAFQRPQSA
jgi:hypothetical protein